MKDRPAGHQPGWWPIVAIGAPVTVFAVAILVGMPPTAEAPIQPAVTEESQSPSPSRTPSPVSSPISSPSPTPEPAGPAAQALADLAEVPDAATPASGYERFLFGDGWKDPDRNGCDARNDILGRDP